MNPASIRAIIWDLDNTLYRFDSIFEDACNRAAAKTICGMVPGLHFDDAFAAAVDSYAQHGYSGKALIARYNLSYDAYHYPYHEAIDETMLARNDAMIAGLFALGRPQAILTNASRHWAERALVHLGMKEFFPDDFIFALEDSAFEAKSHSVRPFTMAQEKLGAAPHETLVVEDTVKNLKVPKDMGFQTALIHHGRVPDERHPFIDREYADTLELLRALGAIA